MVFGEQSHGREGSAYGKHFEGYLKTPMLWKGSLEGLEMYEPQNALQNQNLPILSKGHIRLGKLTELFMLHELEHAPLTQILASNIQIFRDGLTLGELDAIIQDHNQGIHLEMMYKFYLYDTNISDELNRWVGPNRNDSLVQKLEKLKTRQLPLLFEPETVEFLGQIGVELEALTQQLYFKSQLFIPISSPNFQPPIVNSECIQGYYFGFEKLHSFPESHFYIPPKIDWLMEPHLQVSWLSNSEFREAVSILLKQRKSPLCWMKSKTGKLSKVFLVWWEPGETESIFPMAGN